MFGHRRRRSLATENLLYILYNLYTLQLSLYRNSAKPPLSEVGNAEAECLESPLYSGYVEDVYEGTEE